MKKISAYIPVLNEEDKIADALKSVAWADEIIVVDTGCTDRTIDIARQHDCRIEHLDFNGFGHLRNASVSLCTHDWILSIDADERVTDELRKEIAATLESDATLEAYFIPRRNWFMGRWIKHCGWYPDYCQPKLFRKNAMLYREEDEVHEGWGVTGNIGYLKSDILHFSFRNLSDVIRKIDRYSDLGAEKLARQCKPHGLPQALLHGLWAFFRIYVLKSGFLDGKAGFMIAFSNFQGTFYRHAKHAWHKEGWSKPPE